MYYDDIKLDRMFHFHVFGIDHQEHESHVHECLEVSVLLEHEIIYTFGDRQYIGYPGDVFICRPHEPHWAVSRTSVHAKWVLLLFSPSVARLLPDGYQLLMPFYTNWLSEPIIRAQSPFAQAILATSKKAVSQPEGAISHTVQFHCLLDILIHIYQYAETVEPHCSLVQENTHILDTIQFFLMNFRENIQPDDYIAGSRLSRTAFYQGFRSVTGTTPNDFLQRLRLQNAIDLLRRPNGLSILQVSEESGFQSLRTFNLLFKELTGLSPREYRNKK